MSKCFIYISKIAYLRCPNVLEKAESISVTKNTNSTKSHDKMTCTKHLPINLLQE